MSTTKYLTNKPITNKLGPNIAFQKLAYLPEDSVTCNYALDSNTQVCIINMYSCACTGTGNLAQ